MIVPGDDRAAAGSGVTTSYVVAHEYGHHVAAHRSNAPWPALDYGPKRWASYELVCTKADAGDLAPGNESSRYEANPGENWAETYARLVYPRQPWTFTPLLRPDAGALAAARADVLTPWKAPVVRRFTGAFARGGASTRRHRFTFTLDGAFSVRMKGPRGAQYDLTVHSDAGSTDRTRSPGANDAITYAAACRTRRTEHLTITVSRRAGSGPYALTVRYAG